MLEMMMEELGGHGSQVHTQRVMEDLQDGFFNEVSIFRNDRFEIIFIRDFIRDIEEIELKTTFSNQSITKDWIWELNNLRDMQSEMERRIVNYIKYNA